MKIIIHRVNTIKKLEILDPKYGVEIDIRSNNGKLILQHDPFKNGDLFDKWLKSYKHRTIILNIKEEGLEESIIESLENYKVDDYFFLDQSFPFLIKKKDSVNKKSAIRFSEFEDIETIKNSLDYVSWIWIDCFSKYPKKNLKLLNTFKQQGIKLCLVSPELQGHNIFDFVNDHYSLIKSYNLDAVCTKNPEFWKKF